MIFQIVKCCVCRVMLSPALCASSMPSGPGIGTLRVGVGGSAWLFFKLTANGFGETGGLRDFLASIHSQVSWPVSVRSGTSDTGLLLSTTPPFCCISFILFRLLSLLGSCLLLKGTHSESRVSALVVIVTTVVVTGISESAAGGLGLLLSVAIPSVISVVEEMTVERGRGSGRCWGGCRGVWLLWSTGRSSVPLMVLRRFRTLSSSDPRPPAPGWRRRMGGLTCRAQGEVQWLEKLLIPLEPFNILSHYDNEHKYILLNFYVKDQHKV